MFIIIILSLLYSYTSVYRLVKFFYNQHLQHDRCHDECVQERSLLNPWLVLQERSLQERSLTCDSMSFPSSVHSIPRTFESVFRCNHLKLVELGWVDLRFRTSDTSCVSGVCWLSLVVFYGKEKFITGANVMKNHSSECWAQPCNFRDFKLTLEMAECVISPTLDSDLVDLLCSDCWKICIDQLGG